jgi:hypothetical protein
MLMLPNQVTYCRFTDAPVPPPARLTIVKTTTPAGGTGFDFTTSGLDPAGFSLDDGQSRVFDNLPAGSYQVTEDVPPAWLATGTCDNGTTVQGGRADVELAAGDDVTCTFHNTRRVSLTVTKDAVPNSTRDFAFTVALDGGIPVPFGLDDDGTEIDDPEAGQLVSTITGPNLVPGLYTMTESTLEGWRLANLVCAGGQVVERDPTTGTATVRLTPGQSAECVFRNESVAGPTTTTPTQQTTTTPPTTSPPPPTQVPTTTPTVVSTAGGGGSGFGPGALDRTGPSDLGLILFAGIALILGGLGLTIAARH